MLRDPRTFALIGAALEVDRVLGSGFLEAESNLELDYCLTSEQSHFSTSVSSFLRRNL